MPHPINAASSNFTIIVNWKEKGFGCTRNCSYCNWRASPLLPHGPHLRKMVDNFVVRCRKPFVTISGGGDPLYKLEENLGSLVELCDWIKARGLKVRIITRETEDLERLNGIAHYVSVSLDTEVMELLVADSKLSARTNFHFNLEFSLVLPPLPEPEIVKLMPQYSSLQRKLGARLVLRENLNSIFPLSRSALSSGRSDLVFVPKRLCLDGLYLSTMESTGHELVQDNQVLVEHLMAHPNILLFGGFVKHLIAPIAHMEYSDIDLIALNEEVMDELSSGFGYAFRETSSGADYPRYFQGRSGKAGKSLQVILLSSAEQARKFIFSAQYTADRVGYCQGFVFDPDTGEDVIRHAICTKKIQLASAPRSMELFHANRSQIERRHTMKLIKKGFSVTS